MRLHRRIALLLGLIAITVTLVGLGPFLVFDQPNDIYSRVLIDTRKAVEDVFKLAPVSHTLGHSLKYKYSNFQIGQEAETYRLADSDTQTYFRSAGPVGSVQCFINGTDWKATGNGTVCACLRDWYGGQCSIPGVVWRTMLTYNLPASVFKVRDKPRRIIHALNVNRELDMLQVRVNELQEAVDVYLICESNFSAFGEAKPLFFLDRFRRGFLHEFQHKFVYIFQDNFPEGGREDGWIADGYQRTFLGKQGMKQLRGLRNDDLFLLLDADEIPKKEVLLFLKLHDGFTEPIRLALRWTIYGFFWKVPDKPTEIFAISSVATLHNAMGNDAKLLRSGKIHPSLTDAFYAAGGKFQPWTLGEEGDEVGWHCSWCLDVDGIRWKLDSAQNGDKPRWGDYASKKNRSYIKNLIRTGTWFDDLEKFQAQPPETVARNIPQHVLKHPAKFRSLLVNVYDDSKLLRTLYEFRKCFGIA